MKYDVYEIIQALKFYGGGFMQALAEALARADMQNQNKILTAWENEINNIMQLHKPTT
jgi:hypothetical protein